MRSTVTFRLLIVKLKADGQNITIEWLSAKTGIPKYRMSELYAGDQATLDEWHAIAREIPEARRTTYNDLFPPNSGDTLSKPHSAIADDTDTCITRSFRTRSKAKTIAQ
jgi:hypothetical protein